jgi:hypothetical protein
VRYRASINRFWRRNETWDDVFNWGNKHDEMLLAVNTNVMDQNGPVLDNLNSERQVMSATWRVAGRVQTGSASNRGGIVSGYQFPWGQQMICQKGLNTTLRAPAYVIWEEELPPVRMMFVRRTIWEWDPGAGARYLPKIYVKENARGAGVRSRSPPRPTRHNQAGELPTVSYLDQLTLSDIWSWTPNGIYMSSSRPRFGLRWP